ncbi:hypothetical protein LTR10_006883 [Elasticomyces elasticus]|nr:hypothetical protein LTR10_006883 [Elasticomyces elasticus]KAK4972714.1 hypothetical protein LTR42_006008 [Elasticomyces elasticus]
MHLSAISLTVSLLSIAAAADSFLQATALVTNAQNHTELQCWKFNTPLNISSAAGTSGAATFTFTGTTKTTYTVLPGRFDGGTHNAPAPQLVAFLSGLAHITLPVPVYGNSTLDEAWISGGVNGLIIAADATGTGHKTTYPLDEVTVALQIPFASADDLPEHEVTDRGPCRFDTGSAQLV